MGLDLRLLLPLALIVVGLFLFHHESFLGFHPLLKIVGLFFSFLCFTIGLGWLYTVGSEEAQAKLRWENKTFSLKLLDWALIGFILCMLPLFQVLNLPTWMWSLFAIASLISRLVITIIYRQMILKETLEIDYYETLASIALFLILAVVLAAENP